jgi:hypothetical protein
VKRSRGLPREAVSSVITSVGHPMKERKKERDTQHFVCVKLRKRTEARNCSPPYAVCAYAIWDYAYAYAYHPTHTPRDTF